MTIKTHIPEQYVSFFGSYFNKMSLRELINPQSRSINTIMLLSALKFASNKYGYAKFMFDWLDLKTEEELGQESQLAVEGDLICYDNKIYLHQNYKIICQLVMNYMSIMDSVYFNDFFQINKILIYAGLHAGFDMSEEIAALKGIVKGTSEFNNLAVRKLYLMDEALKSLNRYVLKEQE